MGAQQRNREEIMREPRLARLVLGVLAALAAISAPAQAQSELARAFAPTGTLRVGVLMVTYFALPDQAGELTGVVPDLSRELARRLGVPVPLVRFANPVAVVEAFR